MTVDESDEVQNNCLIIDENYISIDSRQPMKSTNTGNPFELDRFFFDRHRTRASQTNLTLNGNFSLKIHRSTISESFYFDHQSCSTNTETQLTNTEYNFQ